MKINKPFFRFSPDWSRKQTTQFNSELFNGYPPIVMERFKEWHNSNPHIYRRFKQLAFQMLNTGRKRYSARTIIEVMRWHYDLSTTGDVFEINGDFVPIYARLLIDEHPEFFEFFELRTIRSRGVFSEEQRRRESGVES
jgi:hypothetical protein